MKLFQSTLPRRERHYVNHNAQPINDFNPRSREGSDPENIRSTALSGNFNPRSREGSDAFVNVIALQHIPDFNPRSREGSDDWGTVITV